MTPVIEITNCLDKIMVKQMLLLIRLAVAIATEKSIKKIVQLSNLLILICLFVNGAVAETPPKDIRAKQYSPNAGTSYPINVYWGDTHLHTNLSVDANGVGNKRLSPENAYRFAKGGEVAAHNGMIAKLVRPLDFLVITDHAANMGVMTRLAAGDPLLLKTDVGKAWYEKMQVHPLNTDELLGKLSREPYQKMLMSIFGKRGENGFFWQAWADDYIEESSFRHSVWEDVIANADRHNQPGKFTAFSGYEWTSIYNGVHRVVIFKDSADSVRQVLPFSTLDSQDPERLWDYLSDYEKKTSGEALAIPHNGNVTKGTMFSLINFQGQPLSVDYAKKRSRWEPLYEVTQTKGDSEAHPTLSPNDEFADYETWNSWNGWTMEGVKTDGWKRRKKSEYARSALQLGLDQREKLGVNPFKFGLIGGTDSHTSLSTADENNYWGKFSLSEPSKHRIWDAGSDEIGLTLKGWEYASSGYAAVWAEENTRESLFAAMKRKEVYASTGPRMTVRFFGGWDYQTDDALKPGLAKIGYSKGVPMGGDLTNAPDGKSPSFLIRAIKDPDGANLDRVQVIKGWHDSNGELHEKVYNVALSDSRKENWRGKVKSVGNTVDIKDASYTNSIGDPELAVVWKDPDFNKAELAFYYVRVLEIPTPRWTAYDAKFFNLTDIPEEVPMITQERAYTSPIWYSPSAQQ